MNSRDLDDENIKYVETGIQWTDSQSLINSYDPTIEIREAIKEPITYQNKVKYDIISVSRSELESHINDVNIVLLTATEVEKNAAFKYLKPLNQNAKKIIRGYGNDLTYFVGCFGVYKVVLLMTNKTGAVQRDAIMLASYEAFKFWSPKIAISCGIAFGLKEEDQKLGDVLISEKVIPYSIRKIGPDSKFEFRGSIAESSSILINRLKNETGWHFPLEDGGTSDKKFGPILSGEILFNDIESINQLKNDFPTAIGGEMEALGLYATSSKCGVEWITIKGICDWGYNKSDSNQEESALASLSLIHHILSDPFVFEDLEVSPICLEE